MLKLVTYFLLFQLSAGNGPKSVDISSQAYVNVRDFGAKGDGRSDDTKAIQKCINSNKFVYFPKGVYIVTFISNFKNGAIIKGDGADKSVIKSSAAINNSVIEVTSENVTIKDICIDGNGDKMPKPTIGDGAQCIAAVNADGLKIMNSRFLNAYNKTITIVSSSNCVIEKSRFESKGEKDQNQDFVHIYGGIRECNNNKILNNEFLDPIRAAVYLDLDVKNTLISGNYFKNTIGDAGAAAIIAQGHGSNLYVQTNKCHNFKYFAYLRSGYGNCEVVDNVISNVRNSALFVYGAKQIYSLIKKEEPRFLQIEKKNNGTKMNKVMLLRCLKFERNQIDFSDQLLESSTAVVSIFGFNDPKYMGYFGKISIAGNDIKKASGRITGFVVTNLGAKDLLESLVVSDNSFKQQSAHFLFNHGFKPLQEVSTNNTFK